MAFLRSHRLLVLLVALLFAAGHAHQVFGRCGRHHHAGDTAEHHHDCPGEHEGDAAKDARHMLEHHALACVLPALVVSVIVELDSIALVEMSVPMMPDAPVAGIDHPPQLVG